MMILILVDTLIDIYFHLFFLSLPFQIGHGDEKIEREIQDISPSLLLFFLHSSFHQHYFILLHPFYYSRHWHPDGLSASSFSSAFAPAHRHCWIYCLTSDGRYLNERYINIESFPAAISFLQPPCLPYYYYFRRSWLCLYHFRYLLRLSYAFRWWDMTLYIYEILCREE